MLLPQRVPIIYVWGNQRFMFLLIEMSLAVLVAMLSPVLARSIEPFLWSLLSHAVDRWRVLQASIYRIRSTW